MGALATPKLSVEEYLKLDRDAELKSEFHDGVLFPVCAVSWEHARLGASLAHSFFERLRGGACSVAIAPIRVRVSRTKFLYPDMVAVCGKPSFTDETVDTITNPKLIVEVLSPTTMDYDYGTKFTLYRELASFEEYALVSQETHRIEVYRRMPGGDWRLTRYDGLGATLPLESVNITVPLAEIYSDIVELPGEAAL